ncbi:hypothetical protein Tco_0523369 [Tanacetum coccineum]
MGRDTIQLENAVSTIYQEYLLEFTSEYGIPEDLHPELPGSEDTILDFPEGKVDKRIFPTVMDGRISALKDGMPLDGSYSAADVAALNTNQMDLFGLIRNPNPFKVKTGTRPRAAYEVPLLTAMASRLIVLEKEVAAIGPPVNKRRHQRGTDEAEANATPNVLRKDHATPHPTQSTCGGESLTAMGFEAGSTFTPVAQETFAGTKSVSDPDLLSYARPPPHSKQDVSQSFKETAIEILPLYVATTEYNMNLARQVAIGSQLRLRFEQEVRLLKEARAKIAKRDQRIQVREEEIKKLHEEIKSLMAMEIEVHGPRNLTQNLETLLEAEVDMKKVVEAKNADLAKELESLRT